MNNKNLLEIVKSILSKEYHLEKIKKYNLNDLEQLIKKIENNELNEIIFFENISGMKINIKRIMDFFNIFNNLDTVFTNDISDLLLKYLEENNYKHKKIISFNYEKFKIHIYKLNNG